MNNTRHFAYFLLFLVLLLLVFWACLSRPAKKSVPAVSVPALEKEEASSYPVDFTSMLTSAGEETYPSAGKPQPRPAVSGANAARPAYSVPSATAFSAAEVPALSVSRNPVRKTAPRAASVIKGRNQTASVPPSASVRSVQYTPLGSAAASASPSGWGNVAASLDPYQKGSQERDEIFKSMTALQTREEQKAVDKRLQNFSAELERAIAMAFLPKSKRDQNIEKYLGRIGGENSAENNVSAASAGGRAEEAKTAGLLRRLAAQSKGIVRDVRSHYGAKAAAEAQSIMADFQKEMANLLNTPGDPQEKQIRAHALNNKYNRKLQKLNEKSAMSKMEERQRGENEKYLQKISRSFGPQTAAEMRPVMEEFLERRKRIWNTPQSEEEATAQTLALEEEQRKALQEIVNRSAERGTADLTSLQNEITKDRILQEARKAEEGRSVSPVFRESEPVRAQNEAAWKKEGEQIVSGFESLSPQAAAQARQQMNDLFTYRRNLRQRAQEEGLSVAEVNRMDMEKTEETNRNLQRLRIGAAEEQYNNGYEERFKNLPDESKEQARAVWRRYNKERADLLGENLSSQEYQDRMRTLDEREKGELSQIAQSAAR